MIIFGIVEIKWLGLNPSRRKMDNTIKQYLLAEKRIAAIKYYRTLNPESGLLEAKNYVDEIMIKMVDKGLLPFYFDTAEKLKEQR